MPRLCGSSRVFTLLVCALPRLSRQRAMSITQGGNPTLLALDCREIWEKIPITQQGQLTGYELFALA